jgi:hypothetical protein
MRTNVLKMTRGKEYGREEHADERRYMKNSARSQSRMAEKGAPWADVDRGWSSTGRGEEHGEEGEGEKKRRRHRVR